MARGLHAWGHPSRSWCRWSLVCLYLVPIWSTAVWCSRQRRFGDWWPDGDPFGSGKQHQGPICSDPIPISLTGERQQNLV